MEQKELEVLLQDNHVEKRLQAARDLSRLGHFPEPLFVCALGDSDWRVRKEAISFFMQQADANALAGFVADLLSHPDNAGLRNAAIEILIGLGAQVIKILLTRLASSDAEVRKFIIDILGEIGQPSCVAELLPYLHDEDENVRYAVVETIGKLRSVSAVDALLELLENADAGLQFSIFAALTAIGAGVPVGRILPYAENVLLRKSVLNCLGQLGSIEAVPVLLEGLSDPLRKNREVALLAFGRLIKSLPEKDCPEVDPRSEQIVEQLIDYLRHENPDYRCAACYVLSLFPDTRVVTEILPLLAEEALRDDVVAAAGLIPKAILTTLVETVNRDEERAVYLIYLLGELGYGEINPLAIKGLGADNPQVRYASAMALGKTCSVEAMSLLGDTLTDEIAEIREAASDALCLIGRAEPTAMMKTVSPYLESTDSALRLLAVRTLGSLPVELVENHLLLALKDVAPAVRCEALRGFSGAKSQRLLSGLTLALTDEVADVRRLAAEAIGAFPAQHSTPILEHALDDSDAWVRMTAIRVLSTGEEPVLRKIIERGLADPVGLVVIAALETAQRLLPDMAEVFLRETLNHADEEVVGTSVRLLLASAGETLLLAHERPLVRLLAVNALQRSGAECGSLFEKYLGREPDQQVRQALEDALRKGKAGD